MNERCIMDPKINAAKTHEFLGGSSFSTQCQSIIVSVTKKPTALYNNCCRKTISANIYSLLSCKSQYPAASSSIRQPLVVGPSSVAE